MRGSEEKIQAAIKRFRDSMFQHVQALSDREMPVREFERAARRAAQKSLAAMIGTPHVFFVKRTVDGEERIDLMVELPDWLTVITGAQFRYQAPTRADEEQAG